jgi:hypothetical protein
MVLFEGNASFLRVRVTVHALLSKKFLNIRENSGKKPESHWRETASEYSRQQQKQRHLWDTHAALRIVSGKAVNIWMHVGYFFLHLKVVSSQ